MSEEIVFKLYNIRSRRSLLLLLVGRTDCSIDRSPELLHCQLYFPAPFPY